MRKSRRIQKCSEHRRVFVVYSSMKISYRISSVGFLLGFIVIPIGLSMLPQTAPPPVSIPVVQAEGVVSFDPCNMWRQVPVMERLTVITWLVTMLVVVVKGLLNRAAPRWIAIICLLAFGRMMLYWFEFYTNCGNQNLSEPWFCLGVTMICLHHIIQRPIGH